MTTEKKTSLPVDLEAGKTYSWCACGLSKTLPLCDGGSHQASPSAALPVDFVADQSGTVYLCACARTDMPPYCDGLNCDA